MNALKESGTDVFLILYRLDFYRLLHFSPAGVLTDFNQRCFSVSITEGSGLVGRSVSSAFRPLNPSVADLSAVESTPPPARGFIG